MSNMNFLGFAGGARSRFRLGLEAVARSASESIRLPGSTTRCYSSMSTSASTSHTIASRRLDAPPLLLRRPTHTTPAAIQWHATTTPSYPAVAQRRTLFSKVAKDYVELPPDYEDDVGLPFSNSDLTLAETAEIFGPRISPHEANRLLRILHGRRVAGTLEDPEFAPATRKYNKKEIDAALRYLRKKVPVNEVINAGLRAEDELRLIEEAAEADAALARAQAEEQAAVEASSDSSAGSSANEQPPQAPLSESLSKWQKRLYKELPATDVYGVGVMDAIRARNAAKWEREEQRREEEKRLREEEEARRNPGGLQKLDPNQPRELSPKMKEWQAKGSSDLKEPPPMSAWARLGPMWVLVGTVVAGGLLTGYLYAPPQRKHRVWPDIPPAAATVLALIGLNCAVFVAWKVPPLWGFLNRHFILTSAVIRPTSVIGSAFSQQALYHLCSNMVMLWLLGTRLHDDVGRANFLSIYLGSGAFAFAGTLTRFVLQGELTMATLGASGAIFGVAFAYFFLHRWEGFKVFGLPPDPYQGVQGLGFMGLAVGITILQLMGSAKYRIDVWSHIFGMIAGVAYGIYFDKEVQEKKERERARGGVLVDVAGGGEQHDLTIRRPILGKS